MSGARLFIVVGDKTDHGGEVLEGSPKAYINGRMIARVGDKVSCPRCRGTHTITEGDPRVIVDGKAAAFHGGKTSCGAVLIATMLDNTMGGDDAEPLPPERDWGVKAASGMADSVGYAPAHQAATASNSQPASAAEVQRYMNAKYAKRGITDGQNPYLALNKKAIQIVQQGKTITLRAQVTVSGYKAEQYAAAVMSYWNNLLFADPDGTTYKSDIQVTAVPSGSDSVINLQWVSLKDDREQGMVNGTVLLNAAKKNEAIDAGMASHEFGHAFFGLKDGYLNESIQLPSGASVTDPAYSGMEGSIMADHRTGRVRPQDLKALIKAYQSQL